MSAPLAAFNAAAARDAERRLHDCCACAGWARAVAAARPVDDAAALIEAARAAWAATTEAERLDAFAAHPLIGDVALLRERFARAGDRANAEQGQVLGASDQVLEALAELNRRYRERHGFIFIVCASGRSAEEMLALLRERIDRPRAEELRTAAAEQMKITELRLHAMLGAES